MICLTLRSRRLSIVLQLAGRPTRGEGVLCCRQLTPANFTAPAVLRFSAAVGACEWRTRGICCCHFARKTRNRNEDSHTWRHLSGRDQMVLTMTESEAQLIIPGPVPTSIVHDELMEGLVHDELVEGLAAAKNFRPAMRTGAPVVGDGRYNGVPHFNPNQLQRTLVAVVGARPGRAGDPTRQSEGPATGWPKTRQPVRLADNRMRDEVLGDKHHSARTVATEHRRLEALISREGRPTVHAKVLYKYAKSIVHTGARHHVSSAMGS
jgi:hypothetical protein